jgi:hypothetical protein
MFIAICGVSRDFIARQRFGKVVPMDTSIWVVRRPSLENNGNCVKGSIREKEGVGSPKRLGTQAVPQENEGRN